MKFLQYQRQQRILAFWIISLPLLYTKFHKWQDSVYVCCVYKKFESDVSKTFKGFCIK